MYFLQILHIPHRFSLVQNIEYSTVSLVQNFNMLHGQHDRKLTSCETYNMKLLLIYHAKLVTVNF